MISIGFRALLLLSMMSSLVYGEGLFTEVLKSREDALRVQIFLDQKSFGPGYLDGKIGRFSKNAAFLFNQSEGREPDDWATLHTLSQQAVPEVYQTVEVPEFLKDYVNASLSRNRSEQAEGGFMPYRSFSELMAERYHTSISFLIHLNGKSKVYGARPGKTLKVPNVRPFLVENLRLGRAYGKKDGLSNRTMIIDTKKNILFIYGEGVPYVSVGSEEAEYEERKLVAVFPITPGKEQFIHRGNWTVKNCVELPQWRYDPSLLKTGKRGKEFMQIPGGPNNPVGVIWMGLSKSGIGIHGTSSPETIGRSQSAGCIRLSNWDASKLPELVRPGSRAIMK